MDESWLGALHGCLRGQLKRISSKSRSTGNHSAGLLSGCLRHDARTRLGEAGCPGHTALRLVKGLSRPQCWTSPRPPNLPGTLNQFPSWFLLKTLLKYYFRSKNIFRCDWIQVQGPSSCFLLACREGPSPGYHTCLSISIYQVMGDAPLDFMTKLIGLPDAQSIPLAINHIFLVYKTKTQYK